MLAPRLLDAFDAFAGTIFPAIDGVRSASDLDAGRRLGAEIFDRLPDDRARRDLEQVLRLMDSGLGSILLFGMPGTLASMPPDVREDALRRMSRSPVRKVRQGFQALKALAGILHANPAPGWDTWPLWEAMGYPGPHLPEPASPGTVRPITIEGDEEWECDVVVVGSGAGGGVAAAVLAGAGLDVVVLDRGPYRTPGEFGHREYEALGDLYLQGGLASTSDGGIALIAGSALGGGTVVNYTTSFATPDRVRQEWDRVGGLPGVFTGAEYEESSRVVQQRYGVNTEYGHPATRDRIMETGLRALGWHSAAMPRNVSGCDERACGWCGLGCRIGAKQSTLVTWLEDAHAEGARIVAEADVERIIISSARARGVIASVGAHRLTVSARAIVAAAGALMTPVLLQRSGLNGPTVGSGLRLHPATVVWGRFTDRVDPWTGVMQSRYSDQFADLDGTGYGFRFETAPVHPTLVPLLWGWDGGERFAADFADLGHWSPIGILLHDRGSGRVKARSDGSASWNYRFDRRDLDAVGIGIARAAEVLAAAGAEEIMASTLAPIRWRPADGGSPDQFADDVRRFGLGPNRTVYLSFHQMGSAAMGAHRRSSAIDGDNQSHHVRDLYVMDGSAFPTASGVNPMISISTIAHRAATRLARRMT
ncbi:MAG TPA: GMC family oxidoreductase N-terminal domain-containing protein [Acidimicrobiia bacterium]|nr:GMC family oxidoreductase N-terminal domain-containing protein [Acidimicrobiia bacterium]